MDITPTTSINLKETAPLTDKAKEGRLRKSCKDFEAIILRQMLSTMRKSIPKSELFNGGFAEDMYQSMSDDMLANELAHGKGMGLGDALFQQLVGNIHQTPGK